MNSKDTAYRVLVTGASGFIGANVVHELVRQGGRPQIIVRRTSRLWRLEDVIDEIDVHRVDLTNHDATAQLLRSICPQVVIHSAAYGAYPTQSDFSQMLQVNVAATKNLLEVASDAGVKLFINLGSSSEYGAKSEPMSESDVAIPDRLYGITKLGQTHLASLCKSRPMHALTLRLFSVYGPFEEPGRLWPALLLAAIRGKTFNASAPEVARDFVWIGDVAKIITSFSTLLQSSCSIINIASDVQTTLDSLILLAEKRIGRRINIDWKRERRKPWDSATWCGNTALLRSQLGDVVTTTVDEAFSLYLDWMKRYSYFYS